jgi:hypothetical protein
VQGGQAGLFMNGSPRNRAVAKKRQAREAATDEAYWKQYVDRVASRRPGRRAVASRLVAAVN